jgi:2-keto-4-pentenoate hydratase
MLGWQDEVSAGQAALLRRRDELLAGGARRVGWKVGHAIAEAEGADGPGIVVGAITSATTLDDGAAYAVGDAGSLRAETELAVRFASAVEVGDDVCAAIDGVAVALELVDVARPPGGLAAIVAANVFHRAVAFGPWSAPSREPVGAAALVVGARRHPADEPVPDVVALVGRAAALLALSREHLAAGDVLLLGSLAHVPVAAGDALRAEIAGLGAVSLALRP